MPARADPLLQRFVERIARGEGLFERGDADPLGALGEQPAGELRHFAACAMQRDESVRIDILAARRNGAEALGGGLDHDMGRARQPRPDLARFPRFLARGDAGENVAGGLPRVRPQGAVREAISVACERSMVPSSMILSALASSVAPVVVMSTISSAAPEAGAPSVAPRLSTMR